MKSPKPTDAAVIEDVDRSFDSPPTFEDEIESVCELADLSRGVFSFGLILYDLPRRCCEVIRRLTESLEKRDATPLHVELDKPPVDDDVSVLDQIQERARLNARERPYDALLITGYERWFPDDLDATDEPSSRKLLRAVQPLNLGRNLLKEAFPCPVLLCLPEAHMRKLLQTAPDLTSWRSGFFQFRSDEAETRREIAAAAKASVGWLARRRLRRLAQDALVAEIETLENMIEDAAALSADGETQARLHLRLGWLRVMTNNRILACQAFESALQLAGSAEATEATKEKLKRATEVGRRAAERIQVDAPSVQTEYDKTVFRGAAALAEGDGFYGRNQELRDLIARVESVVCRFLIVWGETGSGKTSLVRAGLVPELEKLNRSVVVVVKNWDNPKAAIVRALEKKSGAAVSETELSEAVRQVATKTEKTVVVVCDQFEQFFSAQSKMSERASFIDAVGVLERDFAVSCKFIFIIRTDRLGFMTEFESRVTEPLEWSKRFHVAPFDADNAERALREQSERAKLHWSDAFIKAIVADLKNDAGRVKPIEVQLVGAALALAGIRDETEYIRAGRAATMLEQYLQLALAADARESGLSVTDLSKALLALVDDTERAVRATPQSVAQIAEEAVEMRDRKKATRILKRLAKSHLAMKTDGDGEAARYELTHDELVAPVLRLTRSLQDKRREADRILKRALTDAEYRSGHTLGVRRLWAVWRNAAPSWRRNEKAQKLLRRSRNALCARGDCEGGLRAGGEGVWRDGEGA